MDSLFQIRPREGNSQTERPTLVANLHKTNICEASDPRDLVYALLAFSQQCYNIHPDYAPEIDVVDLFVQLARGIIIEDGKLPILRIAFLKKGINSRPGIPSWVPDWRDPYVPMVYNHGHLNLQVVATQLRFQPDEKSHKNRILEVQGFRQEVIGVKSETMPLSSNPRRTHW